MTGLAKFSHLINIEFFDDLLKLLKGISHEQLLSYQTPALSNHSSKETLSRSISEPTIDSTVSKKHKSISESPAPLRDSLHCLIAAFQLLTGQGEALNIDLKDFCDGLYVGMLRLVDGDAGVTKLKKLEGLSSKDIHIGHGSCGSRSTTPEEVEMVLLGFELAFMKRRQVCLKLDRKFFFPIQLALRLAHLVLTLTILLSISAWRRSLFL